MKLSATEQPALPIQRTGPYTPVTRPVVEKENKALWKAAQNFESLFMGQLIKTMRKTLPEGTLAGKGLPEIMFDQVMGSALSEGGGIGLAELLYRNLQSKVIGDSSEKGKVTSLQNRIIPQDREENDVESSSR